MIKTEIKDNIVHTWSDAGFYIHGGSPEGNYEEAYDPITAGRTYTETDIPIEHEDDYTEADYAEAGKILLGEVTDE